VNSDSPSVNNIERSLKEWIDEKLPEFLHQIDEEVEGGMPWQMPIIEDYVLVVAVRDYEDGLGGIFTIRDSGVPGYRIRGLIADAAYVI
jgi:hypothetical protein